MARTTSTEAAATRAKLLRVGRRLFARQGFDSTSAEEIVEAAGLTRGALYHHFAGKEGLFREVLEQVMAELHRRLRRAGQRALDPLSALHAGIAEYLQACGDEGIRRIVLVDGPSVLGWKAWREMDLRFGLGLLRQALEAAMASGALPRQRSDILAHLLGGALIDGAMLIGNSPADVALQRAIEETVWRLLLGGGDGPKRR
jgi:AcrR family transcriptional regulator